MVVIVAGLAYLAVVAWRDGERRAAALTVLSWAIVPTALVSMLSSKLFHYAYPFLPAMALAGGMAAADAAGVVDRRVREWLDRPGRAPRAAAAAGGAAVVLLLLAIGAVPVRAYVDTVRMTRTGRAPLRTLRDCLAPLVRQRAGLDGQGPGVWGEATDLSHIYFHYLQGLGPGTSAVPRRTRPCSRTSTRLGTSARSCCPATGTTHWWRWCARATPNSWNGPRARLVTRWP